MDKVRCTRRRFLAAALSAAGLLLLEACRRGKPTPTPTPTRTPSPPAARTATPYRAATATRGPSTAIPGAAPPSATSTPTPRPTSGETPTASPTPSATPFPPGPPSKLGLFVGYNHPQLFNLLRTGNVTLVKTLEYDPNFVAEIKQISPKTLIIARYTPLPLPNLADWQPLVAARQFADLLLPIATEPRRLAHIDAWEAYNEPGPSDEAQMASLAMFEAERTRLLAAVGVRSCVGNFSTGQPPLELWPAFYPALQAIQEHAGYLGLHEYAAPYMWFASGPHQLQPGADAGDEGWLTLRYRKVYRNYLLPAGLAVPLVITEAGIDGQVRDRPGPQGRGWQEFGDYWRAEGHASTTVEGFYIEQLTWYDAELAKDGYVRGAAIYALAAPSGWETYEMLGPAADILGQYLTVHPPR